MSFGKLLKNLLDDQQMAQAELASAIGYTQRAISKWVNEQAEPSEVVSRIRVRYVVRRITDNESRKADKTR